MALAPQTTLLRSSRDPLDSQDQFFALPGQLSALPLATTFDVPIETVIQQPAMAIRPKPQLAITDTELRARIEWGHRTSPHFSIAYDIARIEESEVATIATALETGYRSIFGSTHESFPDRQQVYAIDRHASGLLGRSVRAHLNPTERALYLVRSSTQMFYSELIHLLTHAMRLSRYQRHYAVTPGWTLMEDAFSIFLHFRMTTHEDVFPFYAVEPDIVAHHILNSGTTRSLSSVWCDGDGPRDLERFVIAGAFFIFLGDTYSDDRLVEFSKCDDAVTSDTFKSFFGASLADLESRWMRHLPTARMTLTNDEYTRALSHWEESFESRS